MEEVKQHVNMPLLGDKFPEMTVETTHGSIELPKAFAGKWFVFFSHPADFTPVCTTELIAFQKLYPRFKELNCEIIGFSVDQIISHLKWIEWMEEKTKTVIEYPVVADTGTVAEKLGLIHPGKGSNTVRAVFIVDDKGVVRLTLYYPQEMGRNMEEILRCVKGLQLNTTEKVSLPANWPDNELIGKNHVIIAPPKSTEAVKKRKEQIKAGEYEALDWWLTHKELKK
jgi:peroxiredoxin (alkyl hydroperoxide reductase subunit C)